MLTNQRVLTDETGIAWHTPSETVRFWLPFSQGVTGNVYTACNGFQCSSDGCGMTTPEARRFGNAGIMGASTDSLDPAGAFAPHLNLNGDFDIVFVHQSAADYGASGSPMVLMYWVR